MESFMDTLAEEALLKEDGPPALGLVYHLAGQGHVSRSVLLLVPHSVPHVSSG
jgi:hypothetical protein